MRGSGSPDAPVPDDLFVDSVVDDSLVTLVTAGSVTISLARAVGTPVSGDATLNGSVADQDLGVLAALSAG